MCRRETKKRIYRERNTLKGMQEKIIKNDFILFSLFILFLLFLSHIIFLLDYVQEPNDSNSWKNRKCPKKVGFRKSLSETLNKANLVRKTKIKIEGVISPDMEVTQQRLKSFKENLKTLECKRVVMGRKGTRWIQWVCIGYIVWLQWFMYTRE